jgi:hypothetical protein
MNLSSRSGSTDGMDLDRVGHFLSILQLRKAIKRNCYLVKVRRVIMLFTRPSSEVGECDAQRDRPTAKLKAAVY